MSAGILFAVVAASALGTFLIRYLPLRLHDKGTAQGPRHGMLRRALEGIGPGAIVALIVVSCWSLLEPAPSLEHGLPLCAGLAAVALGKRYLHGVAWATLAGVAAYGLATWACMAL